MADTIAEIAAECGASERAVHGKCRRNHGSKGSIVIYESQNAIYHHYLGVGGAFQNLRYVVGLRVTEGFNYF